MQYYFLRIVLISFCLATAACTSITIPPEVRTKPIGHKLRKTVICQIAAQWPETHRKVLQLNLNPWDWHQPISE
jgi:hypothetical protein